MDISIFTVSRSNPMYHGVNMGVQGAIHVHIEGTRRGHTRIHRRRPESRSLASPRTARNETHSSSFLWGQTTRSATIAPRISPVLAWEDLHAPFTNAACSSVTLIAPERSVSTAENHCHSCGSAPAGGPPGGAP